MATQGFKERVRAICFEAIRRRQALHGGVLPSAVIQEPIRVDGEAIAIFALQRGLIKPRQGDGALAVTTTPPSNADRPYPDRLTHSSGRTRLRSGAWSALLTSSALTSIPRRRVEATRSRRAYAGATRARSALIVVGDPDLAEHTSSATSLQL